MTQAEIKQLIQKQRTFFHSGATLDVEYRIHALQKLKACILKYENEINIAIRADLGKCAFESYMCETGLVLSELTYMLKHTRKFAKERTVRTPLTQFHSRSYQKPSPYGVTLIMSPWNYPFMLTIEPLIDALAAGNTAILKPSAYSAHTTALISRMIQECFDEKYVAVVTGGREENNFLLNEHFDYIFFTGSQEVGKEVMRHASDHLTPITLELGGKSPCIVHKSADIKLSAKRIVFGKFLNCGQTCVAPDYIYCDRTVKDKLIKELKNEKVAIIGLAFFVICPWHIMKSRWGLESNIFPDLVLWAVYFIVLALKKNKMSFLYIASVILRFNCVCLWNLILFFAIILNTFIDNNVEEKTNKTKRCNNKFRHSGNNFNANNNICVNKFL